MGENIFKQCDQQEFPKYTNSSYNSVLKKKRKKKRKKQLNDEKADLNRHFFKEDVQIANRHRKKCLTYLIIGELQIKTIMSYQLIPFRVPSPKMFTHNKCQRGFGLRVPSSTVCGNVSWSSHSLWKTG